MNITNYRKDDHYDDIYYDDSGKCKYVFLVSDEDAVYIATEQYYNHENCFSDQHVNHICDVLDEFQVLDGTWPQIAKQLEADLGIEESSESSFTKISEDGDCELTAEDMARIRQYLANHPRFSREVNF